MPKGPRIVFKDDRDSSVGRGCVLYAGNLRPEVLAIVLAAAQTAPPLKENTLVVSEGYRSVRDSRDLHKELRAFDISLNQIQDPGNIVITAEIWADNIRGELGPSYDVLAHGEGANFHLHIELDP